MSHEYDSRGSLMGFFLFFFYTARFCVLLIILLACFFCYHLFGVRLSLYFCVRIVRGALVPWATVAKIHTKARLKALRASASPQIPGAAAAASSAKARKKVSYCVFYCVYCILPGLYKKTTRRSSSVQNSEV